MEREAYETLYANIETSLYNTVYRWVWDEDEAMDLVQEAFVKLWDVRVRVREDEAKAYVFKLALNMAANRLKRRKRWQWLGLDGLFSSSAVDQEIELDARNKAIRQAVESLPEKQRQVVVLIRFGDMNYAEIADLLDIPEGTVGSRYHKGLNMLKGQLKEWRLE